MFHNFNLTFNFKFKVSRDVLKNKNECQLIDAFYSKMLPQFWVPQYLRKPNILNNQNTILICKPSPKKTINRAYVSFGLACFSKC